ncbi:GTP cyclohydrolase [Streptomyces carminius]|uniref:GTP cyclohydrolase II n=2 Tax=Streptomyces carminius TaxID=2665496 RepID=A0A2M8M5N7_9ACTN|nr:GTP cyclohydrolase [Streptomyces carminius]
MPDTGRERPRLSVRTSVSVPVRLRDGRETTPSVVSFHGLPAGWPVDKEPLALVFGTPGPVPLVRVHSECLTGDVFGSLRCDCGPQLAEAMARFADEGGILLYLRQEGRGIGLYNKLDAYALQDTGADTFEANRMLDLPDDARDYWVAAAALQALGHTEVALVSNNPDKQRQLTEHGITVVEAVPTGCHVNPFNDRYLRAKVDQAGHRIAVEAAGTAGVVEAVGTVGTVGEGALS